MGTVGNGCGASDVPAFPDASDPALASGNAPTAGTEPVAARCTAVPGPLGRSGTTAGAAVLAASFGRRSRTGCADASTPPGMSPMTCGNAGEAGAAGASLSRSLGRTTALWTGVPAAGGGLGTLG
ncbi:hypothetical protein [Actinomadura gamaensis]|uniref:Uncharacterized protein n=1 Tax=Actinomadura gamaensis TaxID=1763541 RepID=A0ABV9U227_9ACTN